MSGVVDAAGMLLRASQVLAQIASDSFSQHPYEIHAILIPILQMQKLGHRQVAPLVTGHIASQWHN